MVNEFTASPTVRLLRFARGTDGQSTRASRQLPVSAATNGSNARFWWLTSFTSRDDHLAATSRFEKARSASGLRPAFFFGAPLPFLWARPKKWGGKGVCWGFALAKSNAGTFASASAREKTRGNHPPRFFIISSSLSSPPGDLLAEFAPRQLKAHVPVEFDSAPVPVEHIQYHSSVR